MGGGGVIFFFLSRGRGCQKFDFESGLRVLMVHFVITPNNLHSSKHVLISLNHVSLRCNIRRRTTEQSITNSISLAMKGKENFSFIEKVTSIATGVTPDFGQIVVWKKSNTPVPCRDFR